MTGQNNKVVKALQRQRFDDFADQVAESIGFDVDRAGKHTARKSVVQSRGDQAVEFFCQFARAEFGVADIHIQRQMIAVLFAQSVGDDDSLMFGICQIIFQFKDGKILPPFVAISGLGESAAWDLMEGRKGKNFLSIEEVSLACPKVSKTHMQMLKDAGAFGDLPDTSQISLF